MLLVALALLPITGLLLYDAESQRHEAAENAKMEALRVARLCASNNERLIESARQILVTLAQTPAVQERNREKCNALFAKIVQRFPLFANLGLLDADGNLLASGIAFDEPINLAQRSYFQRAIKARDFAVGDFQVGRITKIASLNVAFPLIGEDHHAFAVIYAALNLSWLSDIMQRMDLPARATMSAIDQDGTILARYPDANRWVGTSAAGAPIGEIILSAKNEGTAETEGIDGVRRLYAFTNLHLKQGLDRRVFISIGIPSDLAYHNANKMLVRQLWTMATFAIAALAASWFIADLLVLRRVNALVAAAREVTAGNLKARVRSNPRGGELSQLADAFDEMAASLEQRVAERDATASALKKSETLFRSLFEFSPTAIFVEDDSGRVIDANSAACKLHGLTSAELVGKNVSDLVPSDVKNDLERTFPLWIDGSLRLVESKSLRKDGTSVPVEIRGTRIDYDGKKAVLLHVTDISARREVEETLRHARETLEKNVAARTADLAETNAQLLSEIAQRKRIEAALRESTERFELVIRGTNDGVWDWNLATNETYFSRRWKTMLGYDYDEIGDKLEEWEKRVHPDDRVRARETIEAYFRGETPVYELEHRLLHKDGTYRWILARGVALRDENGKPYRMAGSHIDLTERREAEEKLRELHSFLHSIVENIPNMIFVKDARELRFVRLNKAGEDLLGVRREDFIGKKDSDFFPPEEAGFFTENDRAVLQNGEVVDIAEEEIRTRVKGLRFLHTKKIPIANSEGAPQYLLGISEDITEHKQAREELERTAAELKRSNEELEQFAYVASHDMQEPLRMVASYTQLLQRRYSDKLDATANEFIEFAVDGARRMQQFITDLLQYSRVGTQGHVLEHVELQEILAAVRINLKVAIEESGAQIDADPLPAVAGDKRQLTQLLQNLIGNAIKFRGAETPRVRVTAARENGMWRIGIADNGIGIESKFFERVFVIFQRLHSRDEYAGTGIGLAICKKIVDRHGGRIWIDSKKGEGTTFFFTLAAAPEISA